jgi:lipopolysaccharide transport system permease protein
MGIGMFFASLNIKYRDFQYVVPFFIQLLLFVNPIFYSDTKWQQPLLIAVRTINPIGQSISILRSAVNGTPVDGMAILSSGLVALAIFLFGLYFFKRTERYIADLL